MSEIEDISLEDAESMFEEFGETEKGKWKNLVEDVKRTGKPKLVSRDTRGKAWSVKRQANELGVRCRMRSVKDSKGEITHFEIVLLAPE